MLSIRTRAAAAILVCGTAIAAQEPRIDPAEAIEVGAQSVLVMEEREGEWPYEGVYRPNGKIPIGYRVGGTGICCLALAVAPGYNEDAERRAAVERGVRFLVRATEEPLMSPEYDGGYDVRGWGYAYAAQLLLHLDAADLLPEAVAEDARTATRFYVDAMQRTEIPGIGGWNYARVPDNRPSPPSSFMTSSTLLVLFQAEALGYDVDDAVVERGLAVLEAARAPSGEFVYAGEARGRAGGVPGATGRMLMSEVTLHLAGRGDPSRVRGALDAFLVHWDWLEKRRAQRGTHQPPYGVAPYYFYYAHVAAALGAECLPPHERGEYRRRLRDVVLQTRDAETGTWNDRVFDRSANYGTSMAILALSMPRLDLPPSWKPDAEE